MSKLIGSKRLSIIYEIIMALLSLLAVSMSIMDFAERISIEASPLYYFIDLAILCIFTIDYIIRLIIAKDKKRFFYHNIFDLLAIIPFNSLFRAFRLAKLARLTRLIKLIKMIRTLILLRRFVSRADSFLNTNGFIYVLYVTITILVMGSFGIYSFELGKTVDSFGDALWWSFVTATTVGYGDISPVTVAGRLIASILMLTGIGFIGMLTGTITTFFMNLKKASSHIDYEAKSIDLSDLSEYEYNEVLRFIDFVKSKR